MFLNGAGPRTALDYFPGNEEILHAVQRYVSSLPPGEWELHDGYLPYAGKWTVAAELAFTDASVTHLRLTGPGILKHLEADPISYNRVQRPLGWTDVTRLK